MQVSEALGLQKTQPELDFVDIELSTDTPLFLDPAALYEGSSPFAEACSKDLEEFFEAVLHAAMTDNEQLGLHLLRGLSEPDEIFLGFSTGEPSGRGVGEQQARAIFAAMKRSKATRSGLIQDLNDALMFIPGIGPDKVSDITVNIVRRHLIQYTQQQMELHGIDIPNQMPTGLLWDSVNATWTQGYDYIPFIQRKKVLLVPKRYVKYVAEFRKASQRYYDGFVANFIRQRELSVMGRLVRFREHKDGSKTPWVPKEDIERETPRNKESVAEFSTNHPDVYERFKNAFFKHNPESIHAIVAAQGGNFDHAKYAGHVIKALENCPPGRRAANDYQNLIVGVLHFILYPSLTNPVLEKPANDGRKRIDISFENEATVGIFSRARQDPFLEAREVMIECKNYAHDLANPELDQMIGRFDPRRGRFGIVVCRGIEDKGTLQKRCADAFVSRQGAIVVLTDEDLKEALLAGPLGKETRINEIIQSQLRSYRF
jgi:hypothetical protein